MPQNALFGVPDNKENLEIINHLRLIIKYYLIKSRDTKKNRRRRIEEKYNLKFSTLRKKYNLVTQKNKQSLKKWIY